MKGLKLKNSNSKKRNYLYFFGIIIFFILCFSLFSSGISSFFYRISNPIQNSLASLGNETSGFLRSFSDKKYLDKENQKLKEERQILVTKIILLKEKERENEILRKAMDLGFDDDFDLIFARVSGFDFTEDSFLINKGKQNGVSVGMPVITEQRVVIGQIFEVYDKFSKVILITQKKDSFFDARVQGKDASGVVKGEGEFKLILDLLPMEKEIEEGDFVLTMGEIFPPDFPVGRIRKVLKTDTSLFQQAEIAPFFNPKTLKNVFIITDYQR